MSGFVKQKKVDELPRLPLEGSFDLTYRCDNDCRHCWLRVAPDDPEVRRELTLDEIKRIVDEARLAGCRHWTISGGEPMLRPDFPEIFGYIASRAAGYTLITNGTLITPDLARLIGKYPGRRQVSLYGATAEVHDFITSRPGSFEAMKRGLAYLREAGVGFTVQIVPMRSNFHQFEAMEKLAAEWSPLSRLGASWLYHSVSGGPERNRMIDAERLAPEEILRIDPPGVPSFDAPDGQGAACAAAPSERLYEACIASRRSFHVDPYGRMSFCCFAKDPVLRADLRKRTFAEAWDEDIPAMAARVKAGRAYREGCGSCGLRADCRWCPVFGWLEHGDHSAPVDYLCRTARAAAALRREKELTHRRFYSIAAMTVEVDADLPITDGTFRPKFELFRTDGPAARNIEIRHHFSLPDMEGRDLGREVYHKAPWAVYRRGESWIYLGIYPEADDPRLHRVIIFNDDHTKAHVFHPSPELFEGGGHDSLMLLSSDQIFLARALPHWGAVFVHGASVILDGEGLLFLGQSGAGKSTMVKLLTARFGGRLETLCDDRSIILREANGRYMLYGSWSHGELPTVSPNGAPLAGVFFLCQSPDNRLERKDEPRAVIADLLARFVRPLLSADWWGDVLGLADRMVRELPIYDAHFDKSGEICGRLEEFLK